MLSEITLNCFKIIAIYFASLIFLSKIGKTEPIHVQIYATVGKSAITNIDIDNFTKILCVLEKNKVCDKRQLAQKSLFSLIGWKIKESFFNENSSFFSRDGLKDDPNFEKYMNAIKSQMALFDKNWEKNVNNDLFIAYFSDDYIWNGYISGMVRNEKPTNSELENFAKNENLEFKTDEIDKIKEIYFQKKNLQINEDMMKKLQKKYLIEIMV